jgi:hypothetical protein
MILEGKGDPADRKGDPVERTDPPPYSGLSVLTPHLSPPKDVATLSLCHSDCLQLMQFSEAEIDGIRQVIQRCWVCRDPAIQSERFHLALMYEFKLRGHLWYDRKDVIQARILVREIFAYLYSIGWIFSFSVDVSRNTFVFKKQETLPPPVTWLCIFFAGRDKLRLTGAPSEVVAAFREILRAYGPLQSEAWKDQSLDVYEFKLRGFPWYGSGDELINVRVMVLHFVAVLETLGWSSYAHICLDLSADSSRGKVDTWYYVKPNDWIAQ